MMDAAAPTMNAWTQRMYGPLDAVTFGPVAMPVPGDGEVLLRVRATSLNAADIHLMHGDPLLLRLAFGLRRPKVATRGMDVAATVVAVGPGVSPFVAGDEVMGELPAGGGLAEYALSPAARLVRRPEALNSIDAAALPLAGGTAWQGLELAGVSAGHRVLVLGASGGVGTFAVQLAAQRGADVWASCGEGNRALVEGLGATRTFDYRVTAPTDLGYSSFDAVIDVAGTAALRSLQALLRPGGTVVLISGDGGRILGPVGRIVRATALSAVGRGRRIRPLAATSKPEVTSRLAQMVTQGSLTPVIERTFTLEAAGEALAHVEAGHTVGKVVVTQN